MFPFATNLSGKNVSRGLEEEKDIPPISMLLGS